VVDCRFEKIFRLLSTSDFSELKVDSLLYKKPSFIIYYKKNNYNRSRIGLSVPKKIGKANIRNRLKRLIREYFRQSNYKYLGLDALFVVSWNRNLASESLAVKEEILLNNLEDFFKFYVRHKDLNR